MPQSNDFQFEDQPGDAEHRLDRSSFADAWQEDLSRDSGFGSGSVDSLTWQRLVDNRLSDRDYQALLSRMEQRPELWRDCALAFLEKQAMEQAFQALGFDPDVVLSEPAIARTVTESSQAADRIASAGPSTETRRAIEDAAATRPVRSSWLRRIVIGFPATVAAAFLLYVSVTTWEPTEVPQITAPANSVSLNDFLIKTFGELSAEERQRVLQPAMVDHVSPTVPVSPAILRARPVKARRDFYVVTNEEGRSLFIPVDYFHAGRADVQ